MKAYKWNGRITAPGAWLGVPINSYHAIDQPAVEGCFVTASGLGRAERSLEHFWAYCPWNPEREPPDVDTDALRIGKAGHVLAFQPDLFEAQFAMSPYADYRSGEARAWKQTTLASGRLPMKEAELTPLLRMADKLRKDPDASKLFQNGMPEMSFAAKDDATGIWMLTRPDFTPASAGRGLCDYKTTVNGAFEAFGRSVFNYGYDIQAALALDVVAAATGELRPCMWFISQEKDPPFAVSVHRTEPDQLLQAKRRIRDLLDRIARAIETGVWPGYGPAQPVQTPFYIQRRIEEAEYGGT
jgi:PDDEXK-like domain of unknown function (DUF3799)